LITQPSHCHAVDIPKLLDGMLCAQKTRLTIEEVQAYLAERPGAMRSSKSKALSSNETARKDAIVYSDV
jgi:hypothetical protein